MSYDPPLVMSWRYARRLGSRLVFELADRFDDPWMEGGAREEHNGLPTEIGSIFTRRGLKT